jgi:hypothetical protein
MNRSCFIFVAVAAASLATCSSENSYTAEDFLNEYSAAYCNYLIYCCDQDERSYGSLSSCQQSVDELLQNRLAFRQQATSYAVFLPDQAQACIKDLQAKKCTDATLLDGCMNKATGALHKAGEECMYNSECDSSMCVQPQKNVLGSCAMVGSGQCNGDDAACTAESYCKTDKTCVLKIKDSLPCSRANECQSGVCSSKSKICAGRTEPFCDGK